MKPTHIYAVHPAGFLVEFALDEGEHLADVVERLVDREYRPSHGDAWPRTPEGIPICPKHGEVMTQREKQGDTWYSHKVTNEHGEVLYCRGYSGKTSPGFGVPTRPQQTPPPVAQGQQQQQAPRPQQQTPPPQPREEPPTDDMMPLPDYRQLAINADTEHKFDYGAYMTLRNGVYDSVERVAKTRGVLLPEWTPSPKANEALLLALEVYRDKRSQAEKRGEAARPAHEFAALEARNAYNKAIKE